MLNKFCQYYYTKLSRRIGSIAKTGKALVNVLSVYITDSQSHLVRYNRSYRACHSTLK